MEWTHTLTIILTMVGSMVAVWYAFYQIIKSDINVMREEFSEQRRRSDEQFAEQRREYNEQFAEQRKESAEKDRLWAELLKEIHSIKLVQAQYSPQKHK